MGVLCPQAICSRVSPNTPATLSRSVGLGVQRPSTMANTRCSSRPAFSVSCLWSIRCAAHNSSTLFAASIVTPPSRTAAELRPVPVDMGHRVHVAPGNVLRRDTQGRGEALPLLRAWRVAAIDHCLHHLLVKSGG